MSQTSEKIAKFRVKYRSKYIKGKYTGLTRFLIGNIIVLLFIISIFHLINHPTLLEFFIIPITFIVSNFFEWFIHKGPMHRPVAHLNFVFQKHTLEHHQFFTEEAMVFDNLNDLVAVAFAPELIIFFTFIIALPLGIIFYFLFTQNTGYLYVLTVLLYYINYEWFHIAYHLPENFFFNKIPGMKILRKLHNSHHNLALMSRYNFNITWPIFDYIFGTLYRDKKNKM